MWLPKNLQFFVPGTPPDPPIPPLTTSRGPGGQKWPKCIPSSPLMLVNAKKPFQGGQKFQPTFILRMSLIWSRIPLSRSVRDLAGDSELEHTLSIRLLQYNLTIVKIEAWRGKCWCWTMITPIWMDTNKQLREPVKYHVMDFCRKEGEGYNCNSEALGPKHYI